MESRTLTTHPKAENVLKVAYWLLIKKIKIAENQMINSYLWCPEQAHNPAIIRKQEKEYSYKSAN